MKSMNARALLALTCVVLVGLAAAGFSGCGGKGGSGGGFVVVQNVGRYNTLTLQWRPDFVSGAPNRVSGVLALAKSAVPQFVQGRDLVIMRISSSSTSFTGPFTEITGFDDGTFFLFVINRENGDIIFDFIVDTTGERILNGSAFNSEPYVLRLPNLADRVGGATLVNQGFFLFDGKRRREFSGQLAPGNDGDNKVRFAHKGGNTWDVFVQLDGALQGSPSIGLRSSWLNNLASGVPVLMSGVNDGWFGLINQIIDGRHQFRVVGFNAGDPNAADRETLATDGSEFAATTNVNGVNINVFEANFVGQTTGIVHHPSVNLQQPTAIRITPPAREIIIGQTVKPRVLGDYVSGNVRQTLEITNLVTSGWVGAPSNIISTNVNNGETRGLALGTGQLSTSFFGRTTSQVTITVVNKPVRSIQIAAAQTTLNIGAQIQFTVTTVVDNGDGTTATTTDPASVTWASSNTAVGNIGAATGLFTAVAGGSTNVTASAGGVTSNSVTITVLGTPQSLVLTAPATTANVGSTIQLTVTANLVGGGTLDVTRIVNYVSSNTGVATVDTNGLLRGVAAGTANVTASSGGVTSNQLTFTIVNAPAPPPPTITLALAAGNTAPITSGQVLQLQVTFSDGVARVGTLTTTTVNALNLDSANIKVTGRRANSTEQSAVGDVTFEALINGQTVPSNRLRVGVYGRAGVIDGRPHVRSADADVVLNAGAGNRVIIGGNSTTQTGPAAFGNFTVVFQTRQVTIGGVQYYELDPAQTAALPAGQFLRWNICRFGANNQQGGGDDVFFPQAADGTADIVSNPFGVGFEHTALTTTP